MSRFRFVTSTGSRVLRATPAVLLVTVVGCGGSCPQASDASSASASSVNEVTPTNPVDEQPTGNTSDEKSDSQKSSRSKEAAGSPSDTSAKSGEAAVDPNFPEGASVAQAMAAVPSGTARANIDPERLGESLESPTLYEPCNVGARHFKLRVAVWNGRTAGVDVSTPDKTLASCVEKQVRNLNWPDKVRSLNTIDYSM